MLREAGVLVVATVSFLAVRQAPEPDPFIATIDRVKRTVAPVACSERIGSGPERRLTRTVGTAFLVNVDGEFLTAAHVIAEVTRAGAEPAGCAPVIYLPSTGWPATAGEFNARWFAFDHRRCTLDATIDVAFCSSTQSPAADLGDTVSAVTFENAPQPDGTEVAFTGFPLSVLRPMSARGHVAMYSARHEMIVDQSGWPGGSGSPVYLANGRVIGMVIQRGTGEGTGRTIVRTTAALEEFLKTARRAEK